MKYKIFMTYLLEGKDSRAQKLMEQFQFTGDTPALYYAQAAWEFKHNNPDKASDWVTSAKRIYSPALNGVFADAFYDLGWMQSPTVAAGPAPAAEAATVMSAQTESSPAIEPSPIPGTRLASNKTTSTLAPATETARETKPETVAAASPSTRLALSLSEGIVPTTETAPSASASPAGSEQLSAVPAAAQSPVVETTPAMAEASPNASVTTLASPGETAVIAQSSPATQASAPPIPSPATTLAPTHVATQPAPAPTVAAATSRQTLIIGGLLIGAAFFMAWALIPMLRRRGAAPVPLFGQPASANGPTVSSTPFSAPEVDASATKNFSGGPRQVSLQLKAAEPSIHRGVLPSGRIGRGNGAVAPITTTPLEPAIHRGPEPAVAYREPERAVEEEIAESVGPVFEESECVGPVVEQQPEPWVESSPVEWVGEPGATPEIQPEPVEAFAEPAAAPSNEPLFDPFWQGQPVPYQTPVWPEITPVEPAVDTPLFETNIIKSSQPLIPQMQTTITEIMPEPIQIPTVRPAGMPSPAMPAPGPQQAGPMQTAVQLTFTFEIASMQLTPTFKMGALQVRPTSKVVSMRLAPSQQPQPAMNLQVTFEIAKIQPASGALGSIRLTPSQQQRPTPTGSPSFTVAGLQLVPSFESAPVQLTPSGQGASVLVTAPFQISTVEFSPSFEIASIVLNSNSKHVLVQLPGPAPAAGEGAPMFEIANLQLTGNGDIGMMQLNLLQAGRR